VGGGGGGGAGRVGGRGGGPPPTLQKGGGGGGWGAGKIVERLASSRSHHPGHDPLVAPRFTTPKQTARQADKGRCVLAREQGAPNLPPTPPPVAFRCGNRLGSPPMIKTAFPASRHPQSRAVVHERPNPIVFNGRGQRPIPGDSSMYGPEATKALACLFFFFCWGASTIGTMFFSVFVPPALGGNRTRARFLRGPSSTSPGGGLVGGGGGGGDLTRRPR